MAGFGGNLLVLFVAAAHADYSPAFLWSDKLNLGVGHDAKHLHEMSPADLEHVVAAVQGQSGNTGRPLIQTTPPKDPPEAHLIFLLDDFHTETVREHVSSLPNVHGFLQNSVSSASAPFTIRSEHQPALFQKAPRIPGAKAEAYIASHPELFTNGHPDLLVIEIESAAESPAATFAAQDALVGRVSRAVADATGGRYAALVTGDRNRIQAMTTRRQLNTAGAVGLPIDRDLLTALLVAIILFTVFISGFCCLFSLQTPRKFDDPTKAA
jgi:hypothetical protein